MPKKKTAKAAASRLDDARARMYHDLIFEAAECVFGAKGFDGATMQDIANEAGVSLKTLYVSYPSKQDLHDEIMAVRAGAFLTSVDDALASGSDPLDSLERGVRAYFHFLLEHEDWLRIHLRTRVAWSLRPSTEAAAEYWKRGHDGYAKILQRGMDEGVFYPGDANAMSILTQAILQVQVSRAVEREPRDLDASVRETLLQLTRLLCPPEVRESAVA